MNKFTALVQRLSMELDCQCQESRKKLVLSVPNGNRIQKIVIAKEDNNYVLTSIILGENSVTKTVKSWRELARLVWQRNGEQQLVTFAFDQRDRLVSQITHPVDYLDYEELKIYVLSLARDCDRFEYLVSGVDEF